MHISVKAGKQPVLTLLKSEWTALDTVIDLVRDVGRHFDDEDNPDDLVQALAEFGQRCLKREATKKPEAPAKPDGGK